VEEKRHSSSSAVQLLLVDDVDDLGRRGEVVRVRPGYARNFLVPRGYGVVANRYTLRMQARLQEERAKQAQVDKARAEELATRVRGMKLETEVKVDPEGHMYGSVSAAEIVEILAAEGIEVERKWVGIVHPIKKTGTHEIPLKLKEGVESHFHRPSTSRYFVDRTLLARKHP